MSILRTERYETEVELEGLGEPNQQSVWGWVFVQEAGDAHLTIGEKGDRVQHAKLSTRVVPLERHATPPLVVNVPLKSGKWTPDQVRSLRDVLEALAERAKNVGQYLPMSRSTNERHPAGVAFHPDLEEQSDRVLDGWKGFVEHHKSPETPDGAQDGATKSTETADGASGGSDSSKADDEAEKAPAPKKARLKKDGVIGTKSVTQMQIAFGVEPVTGKIEGQPAEYEGMNDALDPEAWTWDSGDGDPTVVKLQEWLQDETGFEGEADGMWSVDLAKAVENLAANKKNAQGYVRAKSQAAVTLQREINRLNGYKEAGK